VTRRLTAAAGVVLALVGLVALAVPSVTTTLPTDETVVSILGGVLLLGAAREIQRRRDASFEYAETSDTEVTVELPTPGDDFDRRLETITVTRYNQLQRQSIRDDVREVAVATLQRRERCTEDEAQVMLDEGTWTDDPFAASFFTRRPPKTSARNRIRELFSSTPPFQRRAVSAVREVHRLAEGEDD